MFLPILSGKIKRSGHALQRVPSFFCSAAQGRILARSSAGSLAGLGVAPFFISAEHDVVYLGLLLVKLGGAVDVHHESGAAFLVLPREDVPAVFSGRVLGRLAEKCGESAAARLDEILALIRGTAELKVIAKSPSSSVNCASTRLVRFGPESCTS